MDIIIICIWSCHYCHIQANGHPNIVSLLGMTIHGGPTCLLLEFVPNGTLDQFLISLLEGPTPEWYMKFTRDTLRGAYHKHVSGDFMNIIMQVAEGMVHILINNVHTLSIGQNLIQTRLTIATLACKLITDHFKKVVL